MTLLPRPPRPNHHHRLPRAFATLYALILLSIVVVTLASLASLLVSHVSRTATEIELAQLRTLIRHAVDTARSTPPANPQQPRLIPLPEPLASSGFRLTLSPQGQGKTHLLAQGPSARLEYLLTLTPERNLISLEPLTTTP